MDLVTLDTLHTFCGGLESTLIARRLHAFSRQCKFLCPFIFWSAPFSLPVSFLILSVTSFIDGCRQAEGDGEEVGCCMQAVGGALAPRRPSKLPLREKTMRRTTIHPRRRQAHLLGVSSRNPPPPPLLPPCHGAGKGLMMGKSLVVFGPIQRLVTH